MKLTAAQVQRLVNTQEFEIAPKHTGWRSVITFNRWQKYGKDRLYYNFRHYNRHGKPSGHSSGKGYIDVTSGDIKAPKSDIGIIKGIL